MPQGTHRRRYALAVAAVVFLYFMSGGGLYGAGLRPVFHRSVPSGCVDGDAVTSASVQTKYGSATTNLWNLESAQGAVALCYSPGTGMSNSVSLYNVQVQGAPPNFIGYPEVGYGRSAEGTPFGPQSQPLIFPMTVLSFSQLNPFSNTTYSTREVSEGTIDIGYDVWVKGSGAGPTVGTDYEVMILFYFPYQCASYAHSTYQFSNTIYVNSAPRLATWTVCVASLGSHARLVAFTLTGLSQIARGNVSLRPAEFIKNVEDRVEGHSLSQRIIEGLEFGTEFWSSDTNQAAFQWDLARWNLTSGGTIIQVVG